MFARHEKLHITLFIAALLHVGLIWGTGFEQPDKQAKTQSLEVTLAVHQSDTAPEQADYIAQANQQGSGILEEKALLSTTEMAEFFDNKIQETQYNKQASSPEQQQNAAKVLNTTELSQYRITASDEKTPEQKTDQAQQVSLTLVQRSLEISSLEAQLREKRNAFAKKPRKRTLTALSTKAAADAAYLDAWRNKIETAANSKYQQLNVGSLVGSLRLLVAINQDGTVRKIRVLQSSGQKKLDDAAIRVVRRSAPYDPFPAELRDNTDILEIIRTLKFERGQYLSSY